MKKSSGLFWGGLLVILGVLWLLRTMGLLQIDWQEVSRFWPVLLILAGVSLLFSGRERGGVAGGLAGILIALAVLGGLTHRTHRAFDGDRSGWNFNWDNENDDDDQDIEERNQERDLEKERARERGYDYDEEDEDDNTSAESGRRDFQNRHYEYTMENNLKEATLNFEGGAGEFKLEGNTSKLFEADVRSSLGGFDSDIRNNRNTHTAVIDFKMQDGRVKLKKGKNQNEVAFNLNTAPIWTIDLGLGAGTANFDLSEYKVKTLKISTGVADLDIRLGDKVPLTDVTVESGVASVTLEVPESVGCELRIDGVLNSKNMDDLRDMGNGLYRSPGFETATRKIVIRYEAGLSEVNLRRY